MFKFFALCFLAICSIVAAKPGFVAPLSYSAPLVAAPYTTAYASPYYSAYTASYASPYVAPYAASAYSAYPYSSILLRR